jgi:hypothetical protein
MASSGFERDIGLNERAGFFTRINPEWAQGIRVAVGPQVHDFRGRSGPAVQPLRENCSIDRTLPERGGLNDEECFARVREWRESSASSIAIFASVALHCRRW